MNCAIIKNGFYFGTSLETQIQTLRAALTKRGVKTDVLTTDKVLCFIDENLKSSVGEYDFIVYLDKDPYLSVLLEKSGYKLVNSAKSIELCDDKMKTYIALYPYVRVPETIFSPLNYTEKTDEFFKEVEKFIPYPIVVKEVYGSMGRGVYLAKTQEQLKKLHEELNFKPHVFQEFIGKGGEDTRVIVIGGKAKAAMKRINEKDFRSNVELGGVGIRVDVDGEEAKLAEKCAKILNLDYCGVDVLSDEKGLCVCEVNSNAFWNGIVKATGIDVAGAYADYLVSKFG